MMSFTKMVGAFAVAPPTDPPARLAVGIAAMQHIGLYLIDQCRVAKSALSTADLGYPFDVPYPSC